MGNYESKPADLDDKYGKGGKMSKIDEHCPGDDPVKKRFPETFQCPRCGEEVELWSDEDSVRCSGCKEILHRKDLKKSS